MIAAAQIAEHDDVCRLGRRAGALRGQPEAEVRAGHDLCAAFDHLNDANRHPGAFTFLTRSKNRRAPVFPRVISAPIRAG